MNTKHHESGLYNSFEIIQQFCALFLNNKTFPLLKYQAEIHAFLQNDTMLLLVRTAKISK